MSGGSGALSRVGAPALFVFLWSTGFVGAKYGLPYAEPFTFLTVRLLTAAVLLAGLALVLRSPWPRPRAQYGHAAVAGTFLHAGYLGGVFYGISVGVPAGVSAVVVSLQPVVVALLATRLLGERPSARQWVGLALGVAGVALVVGPGIVAAGPTGPLPWTGLAATVVALAGGTAGTLYQKRHGDGIPLISGTAVQYAGASVVLLALAVTTENLRIEWTAEFLAAFLWLVLGLSIGAILLLLALLRRGTAAGVSSLLYLVPPAVAVEAYLMFGERLAPVSVLGIAVVAVAVALVVVPRAGPAQVRPAAGDRTAGRRAG